MSTYAEVRRMVFGDMVERPGNISFLFPTVPYFELEFKKRSGYKKKLIPAFNHRGFDTETNYKGDIELLADDAGRTIWNPSLEEILEFLAYKEYRASTNWFYNITFDVESILKKLPVEELNEIIEDNKTEYKGYKLSYLPHKFFKVVDKSKHSIEFYDIAQFYGMSLNNASKEYLGDQKSVDDIAGMMRYTWDDEVKEAVEEYCIHDCDLTRRLAERMHQGVLDCLIPFSKPYSRASLAETAFRTNCDIPEYLDAPVGANRYFYWAYYGGWFELMKRGYYGEDIYEYDINSAYPYAMLDLPDTRDLTWERVRKESQDAILGAYLVSYKPKHSVCISPLQLRTESVSLHPHESGVRYVTDDELQMLKDVYKVRVISGFEAFGENPRYPFREYVYKLYQNKADYKNKDEMMYECVKRVLNGFYGKNIQRTGGKIGNCFNPIYAAKITSSCRRQIWEAVKDHQEEVISIQTDSCALTEEIDLEEGAGLGQWGKDEYKEGLFLLSGVYEMLGKKKKTKIRGYDTKLALKELLSKYPSKSSIEIAKEKPLHLKQALGWKKWDVSQTNQFVTDIKTISCKYDLKRTWKGDCENWREFCMESWDSAPIAREYTPVFESEYVSKRYKVMEQRKTGNRDGEGGVLIRGS